jgi:hypothetical protein
MIERQLRALAVSAALLLPALAAAEPHFSARSGLRCSRCHVSPTGGGKRTAYGALYALSTLPLSGARPRTAWPVVRDDGGSWVVATLATGEVTDWLAVGADLRLANTTTFLAEKKNSFDATQGTLYVELRPWRDRVVLYVDEEVAAGGARNREAWGLIRGPWSTYLRGGRFIPPFGLRLLDDAAYTRRATGANFANPDLGLEVGVDLGPLFAAAALTNGTFAGSDTDTLKALWGLVELNFDGLRVGVSGAWNPSDAGCRAMGGAHGALRLGRLVLQGEVDLITDRPADASRRVYQLAAFAEADLLLTKGLSLRVGWDFHDADLEMRQDRRQRFRVGVDLFPLRMVETKLYYVRRQSETSKPEDAADILELVLHVYL